MSAKHQSSAAATFLFLTVVEGNCPCGGTYRVGQESAKRALVHSVPSCSEFGTRRPLEYLNWLADYYEKAIADALSEPSTRN